jgi:hypothetical protein
VRRGWSPRHRHHGHYRKADASSLNILAVAGPPDLTLSTCTIDHQHLPADGVSTAMVDVRLLDSVGNLLIDDVGVVTMKTTLLRARRDHRRR